ncbi:MAG: hypothetical protein IPM51_09960 [Sphingobacteriaceae bacterium]|nr:hypothetical protein [Sphingobacteriaceae bacterium]
MKKTLFTIAFVSLFAIAANAQDSKTKKDSKPKTEKAPVSTDAAAPAVNADGTLVTETATEVKKEETTPTTKKSRMAINQKGTPASSKNTTKEDKAATGNPK